MMNFSKHRSFIPWVLSSFFVIVGLWMTLAPTQLGGPVTYAIVDGISMENRFHRGDLVLARAEPGYQVGDAVVYQNAEMKSLVFHRIVAIESGHFILKGDNNSWMDSYHPVEAEIIGKLWMHIPKIGKAIEWARAPIHMSLTVGLLGVVLMSDMLKKPSQHRNKRGSHSKPQGTVLAGALYILGSIALVFAVSSFYFFTRPLNQPIGDTSYTQEGYYFYSATGTPGVYDNETVQTGEPVFPKLTCFLNIGLTYNLNGADFQGTTGNYQMYARIMDEQSGWQRTIPLNSGTAFNGNSFFTTTTLDLCQVESLVTLVEQEAGLKQTAYTLEIITDVTIASEANGNQVNESFSPTLAFTYDKVQFYLADNGTQTNPLQSSKQGSINNPGMQMNTISLLGLTLPIWIMRLISLMGFTISLLGLAYAGIQVYQTASQSQEKLISLKYGSMIVDVPYQDSAPSTSIMNVASIDDLARIAERQGTLILHMSRNSVHSYFVQDHGTAYRYIIGDTAKDVPVLESKQPEVMKHINVMTKEPTPIPSPVCERMPVNKIREEQNPEPAAPTIQSEETQPVPIRPVEGKAMDIESDSEEIPEYFIDMKKLKKAKPVPSGTIEYVINTGVIEWDGTVMLGKIKI